MKQVLILLLSNAFWLCSCHDAKKQKSESIQVATIVDITDKSTLLPDAENILSFYGFDTCEDNEASFRLCLITDKHLNPVINCHLPAGNVTEKDNTLDEPHYRDKLILAFYKEIRDTVASFKIKYANDSPLHHSECFYAIAEELQVMTSNQKGKNILLVYSDLLENSTLLNCYENQSLHINNPVAIVSLFNKTGLLPSKLNNVTVVFAFHPNTREEDQLYLAMINVYKKLLESRGATIIVQANNNYL